MPDLYDIHSVLCKMHNIIIIQVSSHLMEVCLLSVENELQMHYVLDETAIVHVFQNRDRAFISKNVFNTVFVSSHMYPDNPERTLVYRRL